MEGRGGTTCFDKAKLRLSCLTRYKSVASLDPSRRQVQLIIYDLTNRLVAFHGVLEEDDMMECMMGSGEILWVLTQKGAMRLLERDMKSKLDLLFSKHLYDVALSLAYSSSYPR